MSDQKAALDRLVSDLGQTREVAADWGRDIERLRRENDELRLYLCAMIRLLVSKGTVSPAEIKQIVDIVDAEDGTKDGRFSGDMK